MPRRTIMAVALLAVTAACSDAVVADTSKAIGPPYPRAPDTTEPAVDEPAPPPTSPVNGLPADPELLDRRVLGVKLDNSLPARPQSGLEDADAVVELLVGAGFTRLIALFHASDTEYLGPIRSLRPSDVEMATALGATLVISGGQPWIRDLAETQGVGLVGETTGTFRIDGRRAPHNLYGSTGELRGTADRLGHADDPPQAWLPFGDWQAPADPATSVTIAWSTREEVEWRYEPDDGEYLRWVNGRAHQWADIDGTVGQLGFDVLVVLGVVEYSAAPTTGLCCHAVPAVATVGTGPAWVFSGGAAWTGTWQRESATDPFRLVDGNGGPATVPPGRLWVSLVPVGRTVDYE